MGQIARIWQQALAMALSRSQHGKSNTVLMSWQRPVIGNPGTESRNPEGREHSVAVVTVRKARVTAPALPLSQPCNLEQVISPSEPRLPEDSS